MNDEWEKKDWWRMQDELVISEPMTAEEGAIAVLLWHEIRLLAAYAPQAEAPGRLLRNDDGKLPPIPLDEEAPAVLTIKKYPNGLWIIEVGHSTA